MSKPWEKYAEAEKKKPWEKYSEEDAPAQEQDLVGKLAGGAMDFTESSLGIGDELGAIGQMIGGSVYDVFNTDKDMSQIFGDNFQWDRQIDKARDTLDTFEEQNPMTSAALTGAGIATGLAVPAATLSKGGMLAKAGVGAAEGAAYGAAAGRDEGRLEGAALGGVLGGGVGAAASKLSDIRARKDATAAEEADALVEEADEALFSEGTEAANAFTEGFDEIATGISDAIKRRVSPEVGLRVQRADETAMRLNQKDMKEYVQTAEMQDVISLVDEDRELKGMLLDFGSGIGGTVDDMAKVVEKRLGKEQADAFSKYMRWSEVENTKFNKRMGDSSQSGGKYLHTQKEKGLPGKKPIAAKLGLGNDDLDELVQLPADKAAKDRVRGSFAKGEVNPDEYSNPLVTNLTRIQNNKRLLQLQEKFGVKEVNGGPQAMLDALEKQLQKKGIKGEQARDARNAMTKLLVGQNRASAPLLQTLQNLGYAGTLAGPKSSILNIHDLPVAGFNNGIKNMMSAFSKNSRGAADLKRLGIDTQTMGEFTQDLARQWKGAKTKGEKAAAGTRALTTGLFKGVGFEAMDRLGKKGVLGTVSSRLRDEAKKGEFTGYFSQAFDKAEQGRLMRALNDSGGDISKMSKKDLALYDEAVTLGLGQQQLISAAGRPAKWLDSPNLRPLYMMRGFAIKQNAMLMEKIVGNLRKGDTAQAAKEAAKFIALPGTTYAGLNVARNEIFKDDYEASGEEFMYSLLDSLMGPATMNMVGIGSSYSREKLSQNPVQEIMIGILPPGGLTESTAKAFAKAVDDEDPAALAEIVTKTPAYKQFEAAIN